MKLKTMSTLIAIASLAAACGVGARTWIVHELGLDLDLRELDAAIEGASARSLEAALERDEPPEVIEEPFALRRRELSVGARWGRDRALLDAVEQLFSSRLDLRG